MAVDLFLPHAKTPEILVRPPAERRRYTYDLDGNMVSADDFGGTTTYAYNEENRLVGLTSPSGTWSYQYDAFGNRVATTANGVMTQYLIDPFGLGNVVSEYDVTGNLVAHYDHGFGLVSRTDSAGASAFYAFDAIGNTSKLTDAAGVVTNSYVCAPFGNSLSNSGTVPNPFQYVGEYGVVVDISGMTFMRARAYLPTLGRFSSEDPLDSYSTGANTYTYGANQPTLFIDPSGLYWTTYFAGLYVLSQTPLGRGATYARAWSVISVVGQNAYNWSAAQVNAYYSVVTTQVGMHYSVLANAVRFGLIGAEEITHIPGPTFGPIANNLEFTPALEAAWRSTQLFFMFFKVWEEVGNQLYLAIPPETLIDLATALTRFVRARDPNAKSGPAGYGSEGFISDGATLPYRVEFENESKATAPAQVVVVTDQLDADLDWKTLQFTEVGFGDTVITIPAAAQYFQTSVSMTYNDRTFDVNIELSYDAILGRVLARFVTIEPGTGLPPDVLTGFLPPEDGTGRGQGYFLYTIRTKSGLTTGTQIRNIALIQFDGAEIIATNQVDPHDPSQGTDPAKECLNTIDADEPTSRVDSLPIWQSTPSFAVSWSGSDDAGGSGIASYDVYVATDGGTFQLWQTATSDTSATFPGEFGHTYSFYSLAADNVGNRQAASVVPATTTLGANVWHNYAISYDVDGNGRVEPQDVLLVINYINAHPGSTALPASPESPPRYYDVADGPDGDYRITAQDVLVIINYVNARPLASAEGEVTASAGKEPSEAIWTSLGADEDANTAVYRVPLAARGPVASAASPYLPKPPLASRRERLAATMKPGHSGPSEATLVRPSDRPASAWDTKPFETWLGSWQDIESDLAADIAKAWGPDALSGRVS